MANTKTLFLEKSEIKAHDLEHKRKLAFNIDKYAQSVNNFVSYLINNTEEAKDITQDTFVKVWRNLEKFDTNRNFKTWVFTIAKRSAIDYLRKRKNVNFSSLDNEDTDLDFSQNIPDEELLAHEIFEINENIDLVNKALETISVESKMIVLLYNGEEMTFDEIAEILEKPMNTVKSQYRRALISLKKAITLIQAPKP